ISAADELDVALLEARAPAPNLHDERAALAAPGAQRGDECRRRCRALDRVAARALVGEGSARRGVEVPQPARKVDAIRLGERSREPEADPRNGAARELLRL